MKLELKHLAPYLPYGLKLVIGVVRANTCYMSTKKLALIRKNGMGEVEKYNWSDLEKNRIKPILRPLSDFGNVNGFSLSDMVTHGYHHSFWLPENFDVKYLMHLDFEKLVSWHFDVFGLIDKGLAIDINTLK